VTSDRQEFADFAVAESARLFRTAYLLSGDVSAAEDLVQDVLERMFVSWSRVDEPRAYANQALVNRGRNLWRLRSRRREVSLAGRFDWPVSDRAGEVGERDAVLTALSSLSPRQRTAVVLRFFQDLSEADTAAAMGCSIGAVKSHTARAVAKLRLELAGLFEEPAGVMTSRRRT
jgi:RNA polymerase sigma-70 factor (sigma-E family)